MHLQAGRLPRAGRSLPRHPLLGRVGRTPLVELARVPGPGGPRVFAKIESANPGGSVKDRAARAIVTAAFRAGELPGKRLLDSTSGNTGIAYAMLGAALGFGVTLCVPASASPERLRILQAYGSEVIETDPLEGSDGALRRARALSAEEPGLYFYADQYSNPANPAAHEETTGPEILGQLGRLPLDLFVAGLGTSGTFVGVSRFLRRASPRTRLVSVEPDAPFHGLEGLKHMASALVPAVYDPALADLRLGVRTEEAHEMTRRLCREEGLFVGPSSGAAVAAALRAGRETGARTIAVVLPDGGDRYLSDRFWRVA
ncbi:MAG TPA: cysteine synthase family protein [Vicinamibacteria bacterium]|nr:cysteine synthase family protein [Vicinamibacteria bacterium]